MLPTKRTCIKPNESEAERLTGIRVADKSSAREAASVLLNMGPTCVIITMGADGALLADESGVIMAPATPIAAVDTTAAGDAFSGALAFGWGRLTAIRSCVTGVECRRICRDPDGGATLACL